MSPLYARIYISFSRENHKLYHLTCYNGKVPLCAPTVIYYLEHMFENGDVPTFVNCVPNCDSSCPFVKLIPHLNCGVKFMVRVKMLSIFSDFLDEGRPGVRVVMRNLGDAPCTSTPGRHFSPSSGLLRWSPLKGACWGRGETGMRQGLQSPSFMVCSWLRQDWTLIGIGHHNFPASINAPYMEDNNDHSQILFLIRENNLKLNVYSLAFFDS